MSDQKQKSRFWLLLIWAGLPLASLLSFLFPPVLNYINTRILRRAKGFDMSVKRVKIKLLPARIEFLYFSFTQLANLHEGSSFTIQVPSIQLRLQWSQLLRGRIIGSITIDKPEILFARFEKDTYENLSLPFHPHILIESLKINGGKVLYRDKNTTPEIALQVTDIWAEAVNLSNINYHYSQLPSKIDMTAQLQGGRMSIMCAIDPHANHPTFDLNAEVVNVQLAELNNLFRHYGKFDVNQGELSLFAEIAARDGYFKGYVKPVITNLDILGPEDKFKGFLRRVWEGMVGAAAEILVNHKHDQLATKIPIDGKFKNPKVHLTFAILEVFNNAFIHALTASLDFEINIKSVDNQPGTDKS